MCVKIFDTKNKKIRFWILFLLMIIILFSVNEIMSMRIEEVSYNKFLEFVEKEEVQSVNINFKAEKFEFKDLEGQKYSTDNPKTEDFKEFLLLNNIDVEINNKQNYLLIGFDLIRTFAMIALMVFFIKKVGAGLEKKDVLVSTVPTTNFASVAGHEESKEDMKFLVNFLKNPKRYNEMGAKLPKGVVLYGPPGTGKTLTAKAIAGEAGVPFFSVSGSDFIELYAGLGAKRVRDLYKDAKAKAPCIIFIDEIDAIGTHRGGVDGHSEKDQTINALLAELDGFDTKEPIVTIIATNRVEDLDRALIRPGRFDRHIAINLPDNKDRLQILKVHSKNKKLNEDVNLENVAKLTMGFSGAALEALMNEATILAVNENKEDVSMEDINEAYYKIVMGGHKKKNRERDLKELETVAYHEAGHALAAKLLTDNDVPKVTIIPSTTGVGGATFNIPKKTGLLTKREVLNNIKVLYAGRAAEHILRKDDDEITTGASQDIKQATQYIEDYFANYGMSKYGLLAIKDKKIYMNEAVELSKKLYEETLEFLTENEDKLINIATELMTKETLEEQELNALIKEE